MDPHNHWSIWSSARAVWNSRVAFVLYCNLFEAAYSKLKATVAAAFILAALISLTAFAGYPGFDWNPIWLLMFVYCVFLAFALHVISALLDFVRLPPASERVKGFLQAEITALSEQIGVKPEDLNYKIVRSDRLYVGVLAVGRTKYLAVSNGFIGYCTVDRPAARAALVHELAHLAHGDSWLLPVSEGLLRSFYVAAFISIVLYWMYDLHDVLPAVRSSPILAQTVELLAGVSKLVVTVVYLAVVTVWRMRRTGSASAEYAADCVAISVGLGDGLVRALTHTGMSTRDSFLKGYPLHYFRLEAATNLSKAYFDSLEERETASRHALPSRKAARIVRLTMLSLGAAVVVCLLVASLLVFGIRSTQAENDKTALLLIAVPTLRAHITAKLGPTQR
jgi:Zn-dependent protease with chaperone function